jgi:hypothetical protein
VAISAHELCRSGDRRPSRQRSQQTFGWGVTDYVSVFARGIGLNSLFAEPPRFDALFAQFLCSHHHYADALFRCYMQLQPYLKITHSNFRFELYASGEYSRLLEEQWDKS